MHVRCTSSPGATMFRLRRASLVQEQSITRTKGMLVIEAIVQLARAATAGGGRHGFQAPLIRGLRPGCGGPPPGPDDMR